MKLAAGAGKSPSSTARGSHRRSRSAGSSRRSSSRPTASRWSRAAPPSRRAYLDRCSARLFPAARRAAAGVCGRARPAERPLRRVQLSLSPRDALAPWTERVASLGGRLVEARPRRRSSLEPGFASGLEEFGLAGRHARLRGRAADRRRRSRRASMRTSSAERRGSGRTSTTSRSPPAAICVGSARRASSGSRVLSPAPRRGRAALPRRRSCCSTTSSRSSTRVAAAILAAPVAGLGQTVITTTHASQLPARAEPDRGGDALDRLSDAVRGELARFGPQAASASSSTRWPAAVGEAIARNAWPSRIARDGTLHVNTADSVWAFELAPAGARDRGSARGRSGTVRARARLPGARTPARRRPGSPRRSRCARRPGSRPAIEDENLRESIERAASLSLARGPLRPPGLIHLYVASKTAVLQAFSL